MAELSGEHLGQWKEEYPDFNIIEFVSGGSKSYSLWMKNKKTEKDKFVMRMKGITLDCRFFLFFHKIIKLVLGHKKN